MGSEFKLDKTASSSRPDEIGSEFLAVSYIQNVFINESKQSTWSIPKSPHLPILILPVRLIPECHSVE